MRLGNEGKRDSDIQFVHTLDNDRVTRWGGTDPWNAIQSAFDDTEANKLYLMSNRRPNHDRDGGKWSNSDHEDTANHYAGKNDNLQDEG